MREIKESDTECRHRLSIACRGGCCQEDSARGLGSNEQADALRSVLGLIKARVF